MKKLFSLLIICILAFPAFAIEGQGTEFTQLNDDMLEKVSPDEAKILEDSSATEELNSIPNTIHNTPYKTPMSRKKIAKKLLIAIACIVGSSVFLYGTLSIYNKLRNGIISQTNELPEEEMPLDSPMELTDAVKSFIEKTRW